MIGRGSVFREISFKCLAQVHEWVIPFLHWLEIRDRQARVGVEECVSSRKHSTRDEGAEDKPEQDRHERHDGTQVRENAQQQARRGLVLNDCDTCRVNSYS